MAKKTDKINPKHYQKLIRKSTTFDPTQQTAGGAVGIQVADVIETFAPYSAHIAHSLTYLLRAGEKVEEGGDPVKARIEDLKKAAWWICREIEFLGGPPNPFVK